MTRKKIIKELEAIIKESEFAMKNTSNSADYSRNCGKIQALEVAIRLLKE